MMLRACRPSDLEVLYQIDQACFPPEVSYSQEEMAGFINHPNSRTWVAEAEGEIVGFLVATRVDGLLEDDAPRRGVHIITIDVVEAWRQRAVGSALMDAAEAWARSGRLTVVHLEVAEDNLAAQSFYAKRGYERVERVAEYYSNGMAALVLRKVL